MLNIFNDHDYNRSVITIVGSVDSISEYDFHIAHLLSVSSESLLPLQGFSPHPCSVNPREGKKNPLISFVTDWNSQKYEDEHFVLKITVKFESSDNAEAVDG